MSRPGRFAGLLLLGLAGQALASSSLFYVEAMAVAGYSSAARGVILYSRQLEESMQKPSLGFDYILRLTGDTGDFALVAVQGRVALNGEGDKRYEFQLYNAFIRFKSRAGDLWIGHDRPELGLSSVLDSHATLLQPLDMNGFGFDRDWGVGVKKDLAWGGLGFALTSGSGMPLRLKGNYLISGRVFRGTLERDNYSVGFSAAAGRVLDMMGTTLLSPSPQSFVVAGLDVSWLSDNFENRFDVMAGEKDRKQAIALLWRGGLNLLPENRLKLEVQPVFWKVGDESFFRLGAGLTFLANADITLRAMFEHDGDTRDNRLVLQLYYYKRLTFQGGPR
jgi:hypothetical protein